MAESILLTIAVGAFLAMAPLLVWAIATLYGMIWRDRLR